MANPDQRRRQADYSTYNCCGTRGIGVRFSQGKRQNGGYSTLGRNDPLAGRKNENIERPDHLLDSGYLFERIPANEQNPLP